eukprot:6203930-Alexandrium_andersonii.AAC.1
MAWSSLAGCWLRKRWQGVAVTLGCGGFSPPVFTLVQPQWRTYTFQAVSPTRYMFRCWLSGRTRADC